MRVESDDNTDVSSAGNPLALKITLSIAGVITAFLVIEVLLQIIGLWYWSSSDWNEFFKRPAEATILCLGDSTTADLSHTRSWPSRLERILETGLKDESSALNAECGKNSAENTLRFVKTVNLGIPGDSSLKLAPRVNDYLDTHNPDAVVIMLGIHDVHSAFLAMMTKDISERDILEEQWNKAMKVEKSANSKHDNKYHDKWEFWHLKTIRLIEALMRKDYLLELKPEIYHIDENRSRDLAEMTHNIEKRLISGKLERDIQNHFKELIFSKTVESFLEAGLYGFPNIINSDLERIIDLYKPLYPSDSTLFFAQALLDIKRKEIDRAIMSFRKAVLLRQALKPSADYILARYYFHHKQYDMCRKYFSDFLIVASEYGWFLHAERLFKQLVIKAEQRNFQLYIMQYPLLPLDMLKRIVPHSKSVHLIENITDFDMKLNPQSYDSLFVSRFAYFTGHCTSEGYEMIAENCADELLPFLKDKIKESYNMEVK